MSTPSRIGRFEIVRELGRGAMGLVYLAHDPKIDRKVAIKTIQKNPGVQETEADEARQRFLREAQAAGRLIHSGIVTIFDVGEDQGLSYIAMEYIEGNTLEAWTKPDHLMPVDKVVRMMIQACHALDYAHEHHIVHRDIKPANLMVVGEKQLKITDFGLAKNPSANLTSAGTLIGTPNYMSPEQIMGRPLDGRSDLFSLGVVLYELITGERPFGGDTISTIIYRILHELPKTPDIVNPRVPAPLSQVILKAIEKDPAKRYQIGEEFAASLQAYLDTIGSPLSAQLRVSKITDAPTTLVPAGPGAPVAGEVVASPAAGAGVQHPTKPAVRKAPVRHAAPAPPVKKRSIALPILGAVVMLGLGGAAAFFWPQISERLGLAPVVTKPEPSVELKPESKAPPVEPNLPAIEPPQDLPAGEIVSIQVATDPPGGRIFLDDREALDGKVVLSKEDRATHTVVAEDECFRDSRPVKSGDPESLIMKLKTPRLHRVRVNAEPPGGKIFLDSRDVNAQAPSELSIEACRPHTLKVVLPGYKDSTRAFDAKAVWADPVNFTLEKLPDGAVLVRGPYPLKIFAGSKEIGASGSPITLPAGTHALTMVNEDLFVSVPISVLVQAGETLPLKPDLPGVGQVTIHSSPSNGVVYVNEKKVGAPPVQLELAEGNYTVKVVLESGQSKDQPFYVLSGPNKPVKVIFNK